MQISALSRRVLQVVFALSSMSTALTRPRLERRVGTTANELNIALAELAALGLLDSQRLRLTLPGLAIAVACGAQAIAKPRPVATKSRQMKVAEAPVALFARHAPRAVA